MAIIQTPNPNVSFLAGWKKRKIINIKNTNIGSTLEDFPLYIKISNDYDIGYDCKSDGSDIRFTASDGVTVLPYEVESWAYNSSPKYASIACFVKVPALVTSASNYIYIYWGNNVAVAPTNQVDTWDDDYRAVYHYPYYGYASVPDSTKYANSGVKYNTNYPSNYSSSTKTSVAFNFNNGTSYFVNCGNKPALDIQNNITLEAWVYLSATSATLRRIIFDKPTAPSLYITNPSGWLYFSSNFDDIPYDFNLSGVIPNTTWTHIAVTYNTNSGLLRAYINGSGIYTIQHSGAMNTSIDDMFIGCRGSNAYLNGYLDEPRLSSIDRSPDWIRFTYHNMNSLDNELTIGSVELFQQYMYIKGFDVFNQTAGMCITGYLPIDSGIPLTLMATQGISNNLPLTLQVNSMINSYDEFLPGWNYRKEIIVQNNHIKEQLIDFPLFVKITDTNEMVSMVQPSGANIRFTASDGITLLPYEIENWNVVSGVATGYFWVKIPQLTPSGINKVYIYWNNEKVNNGQNPSGVWGNYSNVYHLNETYGSLNDSTFRQRNLTRYGTLTQVPSKTNTGQYFANNGYSYNYASAQSQYLPNLTGDISVSCWFNYAPNVSNGYFLSKYYGWFNFYINNDILYHQGYLPSTQTAASVQLTSGNLLTASTWYHFAFDYDYKHKIAKCYINGEQTANVPDSGIANNTSEIQVGISTNSPYYTGKLDELRIATFTPSSGWRHFEYYNMATNDHELIIGPTKYICNLPLTLQCSLTTESANINLTTYSVLSSNNTINLYTKNSINDDNNIDMVMHGVNGNSSSLLLNINGPLVNIQTIPMYLHSVSYNQSSINCYINGCGISGQLPITTCGNDISSNQYSMYLFGMAYIHSDAPFYMIGDISKDNISIPMYIINEATTSSVDLYINGDGQNPGYTPIEKSFPIYMEKSVPSITTTIYISGGEAELSNNINLVLQATDKTNQSIDLVLPNSLDTLDSSLAIYTHGF